MTVAEGQFERRDLGRVRLHVFRVDRFKTCSVSVMIGRPLDADAVTPTALVPFVLRRGTRQIPETVRLRRRLDELFGASIEFDIQKRGDCQLVRFRMDLTDERFLVGRKPDRFSPTAEAFSLLGALLTDPATEGGAFRRDYVEEEKRTLRERQAAIVNDKTRYAAERCVHFMFEGQPYALSPLGLPDRIDAITSETLYASYRQWMDGVPLDVYVVGAVDPDDAERWTADAFGEVFGIGTTSAEKPLYHPQSASPGTSGPDGVRRIEEEMDIAQGKLCIGCHTGVTYADDEYPALLVYNGLLGAFPHSLLFRNVREKAGLAYYAFSGLDGHKGVLVVQAGIAPDKRQQAEAIVLEQLDALREGRFADSDLEWTKRMIVRQLRALRDSPHEIAAFDYNGVLSGRQRDPERLSEEVAEVTADGVRKVAATVEADIVYFLRGRSRPAPASATSS